MNNKDTVMSPCGANYVALSPLSFIARTAAVYPDSLALVHGEQSRNWKQTYDRCRRFASALQKRGIGKGDTVAVMAPNIPAMFEAHFSVPMAGAVLSTLNVRLDAKTIAFILEHGEARVLLTDKEFSPVIRSALELMETKPLVIDIDDPLARDGECLGAFEYERFLATGDGEFDWASPDNEWDAIALNYTSGTTGDPKGVVYHHRGAYLNAVSNVLGWEMDSHPRYLWTLPMFHCNGWCFPWTLAAVAGTSICVRNVNAENIFHAISHEKATHFCGAPIVLNMLVNAEKKPVFDHQVKVMTAGAPPPAAVIEAVEEMGIQVTHVYGLTETYGPSVMCAWKSEWDDLPRNEQARLKSRQGVPGHALESLKVMNPDTLQVVPTDGETMGEVMFRGNNVMKGYWKNPTTTAESFAGGWFHSGDLAVCHPDGYIQLKDRSKDIIISGGENISSIEIEDVLYTHPDILTAAVVAKPDDKWGETPCAFVELKEGASVSDRELLEFCRERMAGFKCPKSVIFGELPKTSTGKIQKFALKQRLQGAG